MHSSEIISFDLVKFTFKVERLVKPLEPWKLVFEREAEINPALVSSVMDSLKLLYASFSPIRVIAISEYNL